MNTFANFVVKKLFRLIAKMRSLKKEIHDLWFRKPNHRDRLRAKTLLAINYHTSYEMFGRDRV